MTGLGNEFRIEYDFQLTILREPPKRFEPIVWASKNSRIIETMEKKFGSPALDKPNAFEIETDEPATRPIHSQHQRV